MIHAVSQVPACPSEDILAELGDQMLRASSVKSVTSLAGVWEELTEGLAVIIADGHSKALACSI